MSFLSRHYSRALASGALMVGLFLSSCSAPPDGDSAADSAGANAGNGTAAGDSTATAAAANSGDSSRKPQPTLDSTCNNPHLDLLETEYGLWGSRMTVFSETDGKDDNYWLETTVIDNHFDPCADYSYIVLKVSPPEFVGSQLPPKEMVLFFAGEHFIREQRMPAINEVRNVQISGSEAKVDYHNIPYIYTGQAYDYQMTYELGPHKVEEQGPHDPADWRQIMRSDFDRVPQGGETDLSERLGNVSYKPYDYREDWINYTVIVPVGNSTLRCYLEGSEEYRAIYSVACQADEKIFPFAVGGTIMDPSQDPSVERFSVAKMEFSQLVTVSTSNFLDGEGKATVSMKDEAVTRVGGVSFDTHGDSVVISNNGRSFRLNADGFAEEPAHVVDTSRWPNE